MEWEWCAILSRYGQQVTLQTQGEGNMAVKAFLQPVLDQDVQMQPSPLGMRREEQVLYLGPAGVPLSPRKTVVVWEGQRYAVRSTRSVGNGHHVWAILQRMEGDV